MFVNNPYLTATQSAENTQASISVDMAPFLAGGKIKKNEMGWACGAYGGGERFAQGFGGEA
jgi:hypothetical protein